jgi:hypothetical protein
MGKFMKGTYIAIAAEDGGSFKACLAKPEKAAARASCCINIFGTSQTIMPRKT